MELGFGEIVVILVIVLLFFGPAKLPQLGDALGRGIRDFKKSLREPDVDDATPTTRATPSLPGASPERPPAAAEDRAAQAEARNRPS